MTSTDSACIISKALEHWEKDSRNFATGAMSRTPLVADVFDDLKPVCLVGNIRLQLTGTPETSIFPENPKYKTYKRALQCTVAAIHGLTVEEYTSMYPLESNSIDSLEAVCIRTNDRAVQWDHERRMNYLKDGLMPALAKAKELCSTNNQSNPSPSSAP